jgi:hypothetical protein
VVNGGAANLAVILQGPERHHGLHRLTGDASNVLEVAVVVEHSEVGSFGNGREYQVGCSDRAVPALVGQKQHDLRCAIEICLMGWDKRERSDQLLVDLVGAASAEQDLQLEYAAPANLALLL